MALIDIGMTQEDVMESIRPLPTGTYEMVYQGLLATKDGGYDWPTKAGGNMYKAKFVAISADPKQHGKAVIINAMKGTFSFANLCKVIPGLISGTSVDTEAGIGTRINCTVEMKKYTNPDTGVETETNDIKKMSAAM